MSNSNRSENASVITAISVNAIIGLLVMSLFSFIRLRSVGVYAPKLQSGGDSNVGQFTREPINWIKSYWYANNRDLLDAAGLDGVVFLRYLKLCAKSGMISSAFLVIVLPVYGVKGGVMKDRVGQLSMANIPNGGDQLWVSLLFAYVVTATFLYLMDAEYKLFAKLRREHLIRGCNQVSEQCRFSVMVEGIPSRFRSVTGLWDFFERLFPQQVACVSVSAQLPALDELIAQRMHVMSALERATAQCSAHPDASRPLIKLRGGEVVSNGGEEVDAVQYWAFRLSELNCEVASMQSLCRAVVVEDERPERYMSSRADTHMSSTGFVTFRSRRAELTVCAVPILSDRYPHLTAEPAPALGDILWPNVTTAVAYTRWVSSAVCAVYSLGLLFWGAVMALLAAVANLDNLRKFLPFLGVLDTASYAALEGLLAVAVLVGVQALLPLLMTWVCTAVERRKTRSEVQRRVFHWFFLYQLVNVYLLLFAGSTFDLLARAVESPASALTLVGAAVPSVSVLFMNYFIAALFSGVPLLLLQWQKLALFLFYRVAWGERKTTRRQLLEGPLADTTVDYGTTLPLYLYALCVTQLYWVIAPILLIVATLFFDVSYLAWTHQYLYVVKPRCESGGLFFYGLYQYSMVGLVAGNAVLITYMGVKRGLVQAPLLCPVLVCIAFCWRHTEAKYRDLSMHLSYSAAAGEDDTEGRHKGEQSLDVEELLGSKAPVELAETGVTAGVLQETVDNSGFSNLEVELPLGRSSETAVFSASYYTQPSLVDTKPVRPYPHRIRDTPLLSASGGLNTVYLPDTPPPVSPPAEEETKEGGGGRVEESGGEYQRITSPTVEV